MLRHNFIITVGIFDYAGAFLLILMSLVLCVRTAPVTICREPSDERLTHLTHMLLQWPLYESTDIKSSVTPTSVLLGDSHCPLPGEAVKLNDTSTCPSYLVKQYDSTQIPSTTIHAKCRCSRCQISGLKSKNKKQYMCEPVYRFLPVLKRLEVCVDGEYDYAKVVQKVSVSCRCVQTGTGNNKRRKHSKNVSRRKRGKYSSKKKAPVNFL